MTEQKTNPTAKTPSAPSKALLFEGGNAYPLVSTQESARTLAHAWRTWRLGGSIAFSSIATTGCFSA